MASRFKNVAKEEVNAYKTEVENLDTSKSAMNWLKVFAIL